MADFIGQIYTQDPALLLLGLALSYLLGSVPTGKVLAKLMNLGDLRKIGSGSIGTTNVLRTGNKCAAALTLLLDAGKGAAAVLAVPLLLGEAEPQISFLFLIGLIAMFGHNYPVWLKFKGGKGVATAIGILLAATPMTAAIAIAVWLSSAFATRISSLSALLAALSAPISAYLFYNQDAGIMAGVMAVFVWLRHHENIKRLLAGTESKIGQK